MAVTSPASTDELDLASLFDELDTNRDGVIDRTELMGGLRSITGLAAAVGMETYLTGSSVRWKAEFDAVFAKIDGDNDGVISRAEWRRFVQHIRPSTAAANPSPIPAQPFARPSPARYLLGPPARPPARPPAHLSARQPSVPAQTMHRDTALRHARAHAPAHTQGAAARQGRGHQACVI